MYGYKFWVLRSTIVFLTEQTLAADSKSAKKRVLMAQQLSLIDGVLYHVQTDGCLMVAVPESLRYYFLDTNISQDIQTAEEALLVTWNEVRHPEMVQSMSDMFNTSNRASYQKHHFVQSSGRSF